MLIRALSNFLCASVLVFGTYLFYLGAAAWGESTFVSVVGIGAGITMIATALLTAGLVFFERPPDDYDF